MIYLCVSIISVYLSLFQLRSNYSLTHLKKIYKGIHKFNNDNEIMSNQQREGTVLNQWCWNNQLPIWKENHEFLTSHHTYTKSIMTVLIS